MLLHAIYLTLGFLAGAAAVGLIFVLREQRRAMPRRLRRIARSTVRPD